MLEHKKRKDLPCDSLVIVSTSPIKSLKKRKEHNLMTDPPICLHALMAPIAALATRCMINEVPQMLSPVNESNCKY